MKSLTILNVCLSKHLGGIEQAFVDYLTAFDNLKYYSVGIISTGSKIKEKIPSHIKTEKISNFGEWDIFALMRLKKIINKLKPNIIITHGRRAAKLIKPAAGKIPVIGVTHNYSLNYLLNLDYVFATTQDLTHQLINLGYKKTKIFHVPNMINISNALITPSVAPNSVIPASHSVTHAPNSVTAPHSVIPAKAGIHTPFSHPTIGAIGRFVKKKGFDIFIEALSILNNEGVKFQAVIAGDGEEKSHLKELTKNLKLTKIIKFPGWIKNKKIFFSSIDIFCLPSIHEPFGIVLLEALLYSKPTVSFKSEGPSEIGTNTKNILFAKLGDAHDLAKKIKLLISDQALSLKLAKSGNNLIRKKYSLDVVQKSLDQYIKQINANSHTE